MALPAWTFRPVATAIVPWRLTRGSGSKRLTQRIVENALHVHGAQCNGTTLLLDIPQLLMREHKVAILLAERHMHVVQHLFDGFLPPYRAAMLQ